MFLQWHQVILVQDQAKRQPEDDVVYVEDYIGQRRLYPAFGQAKGQQRGQRYGTIYQDAVQHWCVIPDVWNVDDAGRAQQAI
ncbi:MAG: hypothetical protein H0U76_21955 [Ktedonobacteraceae bacterium]|nr:hypothetical protein [Ktedonobacteraceae bacterium]